MTSKAFDSSIISQAHEGMDSMADDLDAATEYSVIRKDFEVNILLRNEGARIRRNAPSMEPRISVHKGDENETKQNH